MSQILPIVIVIIAALVAFAAGAVLAKRKGYLRPGEVVVRCRQGHVFTTVWAAKASRRQLDLGWARVQRCPVGGHWTVVVPVDDSHLAPEDKKLAAQHRDSAVPDRVVPSRPPRRRRKKS
jgi:hypothetical protein